MVVPNRARRRPLGVDVDPLVVAGRLGEGVDLLLGDLDRLRPADVLADQRLETLGTVDREHGRIMAPWCGMTDDVAGVVLAAGAGTRLRPLTLVRPKPLCPVGDRPLVDHALDRVATVPRRRRGQRPPRPRPAGGPPRRTRPTCRSRRRRRWGPRAPSATCGSGSTAVRSSWSTATRGPTPRSAPARRLGRRADAAPRRRRVRPGPAPSGRGAPAVGRGRRARGGAVGAVGGPVGRRRRRAGRLEWVGVPAPFADCVDPASYLAANLAVSGGPVGGRRRRRGRGQPRAVRRVARLPGGGRASGWSRRSATPRAAPSSSADRPPTGRTPNGVLPPMGAEIGGPRGRRRSWPQAASISTPAGPRTVTLTPRSAEPVAERPHPAGGGPARGSRASG